MAYASLQYNFIRSSDKSTKADTIKNKMVNSKQNASKSQLPNGKVFKNVLKNFAVLGISPKLTTQAYPINGKIMMGFVILGLAMYSILVFLIYDAKTFMEYTQTMYGFSLATLVFVALLNTLYKIENVFEFVNVTEKIFNTSKLP